MNSQINILTIVQTYKKCSVDIFREYVGLMKVTFKDHELNDLVQLVEQLQKVNDNISILDGYYFGYTIPQISKEFDLLRLGYNYNVNIEIKSTASSEDVKKQLVENKYYLSFLDVNPICLTYVTDCGKLFKLSNDNQLDNIDFIELSRLLDSQVLCEPVNLNTMFKPKNYLVSPFNSTDRFIQNKYFLTGQQQEIKTKVLEELSKRQECFITIKGNAGTGKTLLTYDIAKECISNKDMPIIIHCGNLNNGHFKLRDEYGWNICRIKDLGYKDLDNYNVIIIDEAQRIKVSQLNYIIENVKSNGMCCIFSYDKNQCLNKKEIDRDIDSLIVDTLDPIDNNLTDKIRTNKEIASFIKRLFDRSKGLNKFNQYSNIELSYYAHASEAHNQLLYLKEKGWKIINYTSSLVHTLPYDNFAVEKSDNAHTVIGQEFDNVVAVIDNHFYYNSSGKLSTKGYRHKPHYHPTKMLFQILTRAKVKIHIVIIDNNELFTRCIEILKGKEILHKQEVNS